MQNQKLLKTFGRQLFFLKTSIKNVTGCPYFQRLLKTFHGLHIFKDF